MQSNHQFRSTAVALFIVCSVTLTPLLPGTGVRVGAAGGGWATSGPQVLDPLGREFIIAGINWFGFETRDVVAHGLWAQDYKFMINRVKELGFNTIRIPYSDQMWRSNPIPNNDTGCAECVGKHARDVLALIVNYAGSVGLHIVLVNHRSEAGNSAEENGLWYNVGKSNNYPESAWIEDWVSILRWSHGIKQTFGTADAITANYLASDGFPTIIGFDLRNEPHTPSRKSYLSGATWGTGDGIDPNVNPNPNPFTPSCVGNSTCHDWRLAAERCADTILGEAANKGWDYPIIFVEGIGQYPRDGGTPANGPYDGTWWGGSLQGVNGNNTNPGAPIVLNAGGDASSLGPAVNNKLVYSAHEYGPNLFQQSWFNSNTCYRSGCGSSSLADTWKKFWAHLNLAGGVDPTWPGHTLFPWGNTGHTGYTQAPVWIGEFGTENTDADLFSATRGSQGQWFTDMTNFIQSSYNRTANNDPGFALTSLHWTYWAINANTTTGVLGTNWSSVANAKKVYTFLCSIERAPIGIAPGVGANQCGSTGALPNPF